MRTLYSTLFSATVWAVLVPAQLLQILVKRSSWADLQERLGWSAIRSRRRAKRIVLHCVSAGEVRAVEPILAVLTKPTADLEVIITVSNRDGRAMAEKLARERSCIRAVTFLPWDRKSGLRSWLQCIRPDAVAVVETEIWPNLFVLCRNLGIPLCILNGRIYPKDVTRYRLAGRFFGSILSCADWIGVQSDEERRRFLDIGAPAERVRVIGNSKLDQERGEVVEGPWIRSLQSSRLVVTAASTHPPEELGLVKTFSRLRRVFPELRFVIAPRRVRQATSLQRMIAHHNLHAAAWSAGPNGGEWDVLVVDRLGWLPSVYAHTDIAVIGGSFSRHGGHNLAEAAAFGCALVVGPHMEHFQSMVRAFSAEQALVCLSDMSQIFPTLVELLGQEELRQRLGRRARAVLTSMRGSSEIYADALLDLACRGHLCSSP